MDSVVTHPARSRRTFRYADHRAGSTACRKARRDVRTCFAPRRTMLKAEMIEARRGGEAVCCGMSRTGAAPNGCVSSRTKIIRILYAAATPPSYPLRQPVRKPSRHGRRRPRRLRPPTDGPEHRFDLLFILPTSRPPGPSKVARGYSVLLWTMGLSRHRRVRR